MPNLSFIKKSLPWLGTIASIAVPGAGPIISAATKILGGRLGTDISATPEALTNALEAALGTPEQHAAVLQAEQDFQKAMQAMGYQHEADMEAIAEKDRENARAREVAVRDRTPAHLAWTIVIAGLVLCGFLVSNHSSILKDATMAGFAGTVLGYIMSDMKQIIAYYFGSSSGSDRKTEIMAGNGKE